jgi:hypothetical protein
MAHAHTCWHTCFPGLGIALDGILGHEEQVCEQVSRGVIAPMCDASKASKLTAWLMHMLM